MELQEFINSTNRDIDNRLKQMTDEQSKEWLIDFILNMMEYNYKSNCIEVIKANDIDNLRRVCNDLLILIYDVVEGLDNDK